MTDKAESDEPVRVQLVAKDWFYVPTRTYEKVIEIDREDWDNDPDGRKDLVEELQREWLHEIFELSYEVLAPNDFSDPPRE